MPAVRSSILAALLGLMVLGCPSEEADDDTTAGDDDDVTADDDDTTPGDDDDTTPGDDDDTTAGDDDDSATYDPLILEAYGTFECMGIIADLPAGYAVEDIAEVAVWIDDAGWQPIQSAVQVGSEDYFATSAFGLAPGTEYTFRVQALDTGGDVLASGTVTGSTRDELALPTPATELHVSPDGDDGGAGTPADPFATIGRALSQAAPGTTVYAHEGTYREGDLTPPVSGAPGSPIVVTAWGTDEVVLDGADADLVDSAGWTEVAPQVFTHPWPNTSRNVTLQRRSDGTVYRAYIMDTAGEVLDQSSAGMTFAQLQIDAAYNTDGATITLRVPDGDVADFDVHVAEQTTAFYFDGLEHLWVEGLTIRHYGQGSYGRGIYVRSSSDVVISGCTFEYDNTGVWVKGDSDQVVVQDCTMIDDAADWYWGYMKGMATVYAGDLETGLVNVDGTYDGRGLVVRRNHVEGLFDGFKIAPVNGYAGRTAETDFHDNTVIHVADDVVETDGYSRNVRIFGNEAHESLSGISLAQALDGPVWIVRNLIADAGLCKATELEGYEGYPFKTNGGPSPEVGSGEVFFFHNTAYTHDPASAAMLIKADVIWREFTLRNNIWCGLDRGFVSWRDTVSPMDWDHDALWTGGSPYAEVGNTEYDDLATFTGGTGWLIAGTDEWPMFADEDGGDYSLDEASPLIDRGVLIPGINEDYLGCAPDLGWIENL